MRGVEFLIKNFAFMIDLYNIAKLFLGCKLGGRLYYGVA